MEILFVGSLSGFQAAVLLVLYFGLICYSLMMAMRNEAGSSRLLWVLIILFVPLIGVTAYLLKHLFYGVKAG